MSFAKVVVTVAPGRSMAETIPGSVILDQSDPTGRRIASSRLRTVLPGETIAVDAAAVPGLVARGVILDPATGGVVHPVN